MFTFMSPLASAMIAPAASQSAQEFGITNSTVSALQVSVFVLAYGACVYISGRSPVPDEGLGVALGPLFLGPISEIYGRSRVLQLSNLFFLCRHPPFSIVFFIYSVISQCGILSADSHKLQRN